MTNHNRDRDPAMADIQGAEILKRLGFTYPDQMVESANLDLFGSGYLKLHVTFVLSIKQLKQMGVDLNA